MKKINLYTFYLLPRGIRLTFALLIIIQFFSGCKKFVEVGVPKTEIVSETVFTTDASATSAIRGVYSMMMNNQSFSNGGIERYTGIMCDELINYSTADAHLQFYLPTLLANNSIVTNEFWREAYKYINNANAILEGLEKSVSITAAVKSQLRGEALFIRAFSHFYLVNLFGDIPYIRSINYKENAIAYREPVEAVYSLIVQDLLEAKTNLSDTYSFSGNERIQPNKGAATALLARVYLYQKDWSNAEIQATELINNTSLYALETDLNLVFLKGSKESILQLKPVTPGKNTSQGQFFILNGVPTGQTARISLSENIVNSFEPGDNRSTNWVDTFTNSGINYYYAYKYKVYLNSTVTEYSVVFRLAEQFLIRAEARAQLNNISGSQADLDKIRNRAGLGNTTAADKVSLLAAIEKERKVELFCEWGHRWIDLKRLNRANTILPAIKQDWQTTDALFPIPLSDLLLNPNLTQNPGY